MDATAQAFGRGLEDHAGVGAAAGSLLGSEPYTVEHHVGRLVELRVFDLASPGDVASLGEAMVAGLASMDGLVGVGGKAILLADHRAAGPFPQEVGDAWSRAMRRFNARLERSAILLDRSNETFNLQIARVVRCAGCPRRRWFYEASEARAWLADVLTPAEAARLDAVFF